MGTPNPYYVGQRPWSSSAPWQPSSVRLAASKLESQRLGPAACRRLSSAQRFARCTGQLGSAPHQLRDSAVSMTVRTTGRFRVRTSARYASGHLATGSSNHSLMSDPLCADRRFNLRKGTSDAAPNLGWETKLPRDLRQGEDATHGPSCRCRVARYGFDHHCVLTAEVS